MVMPHRCVCVCVCARACVRVCDLNPTNRHGAPILSKKQLPFMQEWETRQMTSRSTGSTLSIASHVIPERLRHMTHLFNILPSFPEENNSPQAGELATSLSLRGALSPPGSWIVPGISGNQETSGEAASVRITPSAASLRWSLDYRVSPLFFLACVYV